MTFDRTRTEQFLQLAADRLDGEWLLIGGGAAAAWFAAGRTTEDLDLIGLANTQDERYALMELATEAGLPVEAVNSAGGFFVRRIPDWKAHLVVLLRGGRATIYRPDATLFLLLKISRLSEVDLGDCLALLGHAEQTGEPVDVARVRAELAALPATDDVALRERRARLMQQLDG